MKTFITAAASCAAVLALAASPVAAQPTGGPDAKGNAPLKHAHTVNDGSAKPGHNSFTRGQAQKHIEKSGYTNVEGLSKGKDGVWRGTAMKNGATVPVGMDFKGNVVEGAAVGGDAQAAMVAPPAGGGASTMSTTTTSTTSTAAAAGAGTGMATHHVRHHRHHMKGCSLHPGPNGVACSGVDKNQNGVSDKEDRATGK